MRCAPTNALFFFVKLLYKSSRYEARKSFEMEGRESGCFFYQGSCGESGEDRLLWLPSDSIARLCVPSEYGARKEAESVERGIGVG